MAQEITLKFVDGSSSECEVTGREKGDEQTFYIPLSSLKCGSLELEGRYEENHYVNVIEVGEDYAVVEVSHRWGSTKDGPYKVCLGEKSVGCSYYFGEWNYYYSLSLEWHED